MNRPANPNKLAIHTLESAGTYASGQGEHGLANQCWALAARLRHEGHEAVEAYTRLRRTGLEASMPDRSTPGHVTQVPDH